MYDLCGVAPGDRLQGRSLVPLLTGETTKHREHVVVEYAPNEEAMIRDERWKLVYERGVERRTDGYDTAEPLVPNVFRLYDLVADPQEMHNVAADPANAATLERLTGAAGRASGEDRPPAGAIAELDDPLVLLDFCVQSRDVAPEGKRLKRCFA